MDKHESHLEDFGLNSEQVHTAFGKLYTTLWRAFVLKRNG